MDQPRPVSLRDIAARTGVTIMSVSRALRGSPQVSAAKREEILRVARELGYRPDPQVSRLMALMRANKTRRADTVLALINTRHERGIHLREPHLNALYQSAAQRADTLGYKLEEFWLADPDLSPRRQQSILIARGIEGLLLFPFERGQRSVPLELSRFAVTGVGRSHDSVPCDRATPNHFAAVKIALEHLAALGFTRLGLALFDGTNERTDRRYSAAYCDFVQCQAPEARIPLLECLAWDAAAFRAWFDQHRPQVVLTHGEHIREFAALDLSLHAPRDFGYVNLNHMGKTEPSSGIDQNYGLVGAAAVDLLVGQLNHQDRGLPPFPRSVTIHGFWRDGDSLPPRPRRKKA